MRDLTPEERAAMYRARAALHRASAARDELLATMTETAAVMQKFVAMVQAGFDAETATHPDLAELNVQLDGYYGPA
ncbi:hypothetical protein ACWGHD_04700 [Streptomyces xanthophaeus]